MSDIEFDLALKDEMSGPAKEAKSAVHALSEELHHAGESHKKLGDEMHELGRKSHESKGFLEEFSKSLIPQIALGELAAEGIKKLGEGLIEGVKFAVEASEFRENMTSAYGAIKGGTEEGERTFREIDKLATGLHMPTEKAHELAQSLMLQGLTNQKELTDTITSISHLQRIGLEAGAEKLQSVISRSLASGHFEVKAKSLSGTGVSMDQLYAGLADKLHIPIDKVQQEMKDGLIDVDDGIEAITDAIGASKIAEVAKEKFTIGDAMTDMKNTVRGLFQDADSGPLVEAFRSVADSIKPGTEGAREFKDTLNAIISVSASVVSALSKVGSAVSEAFSAVVKAGDWLENLTTGGGGGMYDTKEMTADQKAIVDAFNVRAKAKHDLINAANEELKEKSNAFDARFEAADKREKRAAERERLAREHQASGGSHGHSGYYNEAEERGVRSGGISAESLKNWQSLLGEMGLAGGKSPSVAPAKVTQSRDVHMGGVTVQIHGVDRAQELMTLLPSALVDVLEQASLEAGA